MLWLTAILSAPAAPPVAVVELFTSQGCSSCPEADRVLSAIASEARTDGHPVYVLSFHVDYWNKLGWVDPYSDPRWTGRQREYSETLGEAGRVYTPQVVVNGTQHVVGSKEPLVKGLIAGALMGEVPVTVSGTARFAKKSVTIDIATEGATKSAQMFVAVIEPERQNEVPKGENRGQKLVHANVVRAMVKADPTGQEGEVPLPPDVDVAKAEVFVWLQSPLTNEVLGATRLTRAD